MRNGIRQRGVARCHVIERAVRFHVLKTDVLTCGDISQRADLVGHALFDLAGGEPHLATAEAAQIRERRVSANGNTILAGERDRGAHGPRVAGVEAAGDAG